MTLQGILSLDDIREATRKVLLCNGHLSRPANYIWAGQANDLTYSSPESSEAKRALLLRIRAAVGGDATPTEAASQHTVRSGCLCPSCANLSKHAQVLAPRRRRSKLPRVSARGPSQHSCFSGRPKRVGPLDKTPSPCYGENCDLRC